MACPPARRPRRELRSARRLEARPGPATAHRHRCRAPPPPPGIANLSRETAVAFASSYVPGVETVVAFAGLKWAILVRFWVAEVTVVSMGAVQGRALVLMVSLGDRGPAVCDTVVPNQ